MRGDRGDVSAHVNISGLESLLLANLSPCSQRLDLAYEWPTLLACIAHEV